MRAFLVGSCLSLAALAQGGCLTTVSDDCTRSNTCAQGGSGTGASSGAAGQGGQGGQGGAEPGTCVPSDNGEGMGVPASCGLFVATGGSGDGSQQNPFGTIGEALEVAAGGDRIYVCQGAYVESVTLPHGVTVHGGLDCEAGWTFTPGDKSTLVGEPLNPAVRIAGDSELSTVLADMRVEAPDATLAGTSSIGMLIEGGKMHLENVDVIAGDGAAGVTGDTPSINIGPTDSNDPAIRGNGPRMTAPGSCNGINYNEAPEKANPMCSTSVGGKGGYGANGLGVPQPGGAGEVNGGDGGTNTGSLPGACGIAGCCRTNGPGDPGNVGATGTHGVGATGEGALSSLGWQGTTGGAADRGEPGSGGGGGAGAEKTGGENCGGGGNGGGAGGCGGFGGEGGGPGGGSFAVIVLGGELSTAGGSLVAGNGGNGGDGGAGQPGAVGGNGGTGGVCSGGKGGDGGDGGQGGGGLGGHSIAVAIGLGTVDVAQETAVMVGDAGEGGQGGDAQGDGENGVAEPTYTLDVL